MNNVSIPACADILKFKNIIKNMILRSSTDHHETNIRIEVAIVAQYTWALIVDATRIVDAHEHQLSGVLLRFVLPSLPRVLRRKGDSGRRDKEKRNGETEKATTRDREEGRNKRNRARATPGKKNMKKVKRRTGERRN